MENFAIIIDSVANLLWPLIVIAVLFTFRKSVRGLIESARGRKFNVKIGDMELSMDEFSQQQSTMIKDLQTRINELQRQVEGTAKATEEKSTTKAAPASKKVAEKRDAEKATALSYADINLDDDISDILWVDDNPRNNALLIDALHYLDISVSTAASTLEALEHFKHGSFDCVISDSCRREGKEFDNCQAGIELASQIRELDDEVPIYIYTDKVDEKLRQRAESVGATAVTSSPSELLKLLSD